MQKNNGGFTLVELLLVISLFTVITGLGTTALFRVFSQSRIESVLPQIVSALQEARNKSISSDTQGEATSQSFGIHFESTSYILFAGDTYNPTDPNNISNQLPQNMTVTPSLPCPSPPENCNNITFEKVSGEISSFDNSNNSVCLADTTGRSFLVEVNFVGVINAVQSGC